MRLFLALACLLGVLLNLASSLGSAQRELSAHNHVGGMMGGGGGHGGGGGGHNAHNLHKGSITVPHISNLTIAGLDNGCKHTKVGAAQPCLCLCMCSCATAWYTRILLYFSAHVLTPSLTSSCSCTRPRGT
jgi:hypothetical protein